MEKILHVNNNRDLQALFGKYDQNIKLIEQGLSVKVLHHEQGLRIIGKRGDVQKTCELIIIWSAS